MMYKEEYVLMGGDTISEDTILILLLPMRLNEDHLVVQQYQNFRCNSPTIKISELNTEITKSAELLFFEITAYLLSGNIGTLDTN